METNITRSDIMNTDQEMVKPAHNPDTRHREGAIGMLEYSNATYSLRVRHPESGGGGMIIYAEATYARRMEDRRSVSGGVLKLAGAAVL